jgi:hypothetical protein
LLYTYHKFVWWCALNLIESKCDLSKIVKFEVHTMTCNLMIQDFISHMSIHHLFECVFESVHNSTTSSCVYTIAWMKMQPNIFVWLILHVHGLGYYDDHWDHRHNHTYKTYLW